MIIEKDQKMNDYGDSFTFGVGASNPNQNYVNELASKLGVTVNNLGKSGGGVIEMLKQAWIPSQSVSSVNNSYPCTVMTGFNDAMRGGTEEREKIKIYNAYIAFFANQFLNTARPLSDGTITKVGSWTSVGSNSNYPLKSVLGLSGTGRSNNVANSSVSFTITGSTVVIGYITNDAVATGVDFSTFDVFVDGVLHSTVDTNDKSLAVADSYWSNAYSVSAFVAQDLGAGTHTIQIVNKENKTLILDYVGTLNPPSACPKLFVSTIPRPNPASYPVDGNGNPRPYVPTDASIDACSQQILLAIKEFRGYPITVVDVMQFLDLSGISGDNVHPNDKGHSQIAEAFMDVMLGTVTNGIGQSSYTDSSGNIKIFIGHNGRYRPDGSFEKIDTTKDTMGIILNSTGADSVVSVGLLQANGSGGVRYVWQVDQTGRDSMAYGRGTGSISTGQTQVVINHGCPFTPSSVIITPTSFMPPWRVVSIGATSFTVQIQSASVAGESFGWKCL